MATAVTPLISTRGNAVPRDLADLERYPQKQPLLPTLSQQAIQANLAESSHRQNVPSQIPRCDFQLRQL